MSVGFATSSIVASPTRTFVTPDSPAPAEDPMEARAAQVAVDDADALTALRESDRDAARDGGLALGRRRARHEQLPVRPVGVHEH